ncbi:MAG: carbonic anhydrase [Actinobacteria bacterium]|uniref:carbonic anhydrase n=1 Tax=freshwater metagenome TaxID=449393 RepID=A0A6J7H4F4_9ZZZZ|nr:carbonic anhydrase [Actinomycetota bacterium]
MTRVSPAKAWDEMLRGNERFTSGQPAHPRQDIERLSELQDTQTPSVALFGCSDSRLAAEIIFDKGLGDLFVVRNAGQIISDSVIGSLEYAVGVLGVSLILVLGHDNCGAVSGAIALLDPENPGFPPHVTELVNKITPAVRRVAGAQKLFGADGSVDFRALDTMEVEREHLRDTISELLETSELISESIAAGNLAVVGANYRLGEGRVTPDVVVGIIDETPPTS